MYRFLIVFILLASVKIPSANGFWYDEKMGLDWESMVGRYTGFQAVQKCAGFSSAHYRLPEIEEIKEAYQNGISDPEINPQFAEKILEKKIYFSDHLMKKSENQYLRLLFNFENGMTFWQKDKSNIFLGLLCVTEPGHRLYWYDREQDLYWKRMPGRTTLFVARHECKGYLNNSWLPSIDQLENAFLQGLASEKANEIFGYALKQYGLILSDTPETENSETSHWALNASTGKRVAVEVGFDHKYYFVCPHIFD